MKMKTRRTIPGPMNRARLSGRVREVAREPRMRAMSDDGQSLRDDAYRTRGRGEWSGRQESRAVYA